MKTLIACLIMAAAPLWPQSSDWVTFTSRTCINVRAVADDADHLWIGASNHGLLKIHKTTGDITYFNPANSGLPSNLIWDLAIDSQGSLWIGTFHGGLAKFDGSRWTVYNEGNSGLPDDDVRAIAIDARGHVWAGTWNGGLVKFDGLDWTVMWDRFHYALTADPQGNIWAGIKPLCGLSDCSMGGLLKFVGDSLHFTPLANVWRQGRNLTSIGVDSKGIAWLGTSIGVLKYDGSNWTPLLRDYYVNTVAVDANDNIWAGYNGGLAMYDSITWTMHDSVVSNLPNRNVNKLAFDSQGSLWAGLPYGNLIKFDSNDWQKVETGNSNIHNNNLSALAVRNGSELWAGAGNGVVNYSNGSWTVYNRQNAFSYGEDVGYITVDMHNNLWVGLQQDPMLSVPHSGLFKFDGATWHVNCLGWISVTCLAADNDGHILMGSDFGLSISDTGDTVYSHPCIKYDIPELSGKSISGLAYDTTGNLWIGTQESSWDSTPGFLAEYNGNSCTIYNTLNSGLPSNNITALFIDKNDDKWIGTDRGLCLYDGQDWSVYNTANSGLPGDTVYCISPDSAGNLWFGTASGAACFDMKKWTVYNTDNSALLSNHINSIAIDMYGNKWIGTQWGGLTVYQKGGIVLDHEAAEHHPVDRTVYIAQNRPNPFNSRTIIPFNTGSINKGLIRIYDVSGRLVFSNSIYGKGKVSWHAANLPNGMYMVRLTAGHKSRSRRIVLLR